MALLSDERLDEVMLIVQDSVDVDVHAPLLAHIRQLTHDLEAAQRERDALQIVNERNYAEACRIKRDLEAAHTALRENERLTEQRSAIGEIIAYFGCMGICAHGPCNVEKECEECHMDRNDDWCIACRIAEALAAKE